MPYAALILQHPQLQESNLLRVNKMCVKTTAFILFADDYSLTCEQKSGIFMGFFCMQMPVTKEES